MKRILLLFARNPRRSPFPGEMTASLQLIVARSGFQLSGSPLFADRASRNARYSSSSDPRISNLLASTDDPLANVESIAGTAPSRARSLSLGSGFPFSLSFSLLPVLGIYLR